MPIPLTSASKVSGVLVVVSIFIESNSSNKLINIVMPKKYAIAIEFFGDVNGQAPAPISIANSSPVHTNPTLPELAKNSALRVFGYRATRVPAPAMISTVLV